MADDLPTSRIRRAARLARLGARTATGLALRRDPADLAAFAADALADLRGLAAKAGQVGSYLDAALGTELPPGVREALQRLNDATRTSPYPRVVEVVRADLPDVADDLLARLDPVPVASGSIAQVHRAALPDGTPVAVKVQHPGVARVVLDELGQAGVIASVVGAIVPGTQAIVDEVRRRFGDELDQRKEAASTRAYAAQLADLDDVVLPKVVDAWSGPHVLTTTWCDGISLDDAAREPDDGLRTRWAEALLGSFAASTVRGLVHADPNAGNFRFAASGHLAILDLGCVQPIPDVGRQAFARAFATGDVDGLARLLVEGDGPAAAPARAMVSGMVAPFVTGGVLQAADLRQVGRDLQTLKATMARQRLGAPLPWAPLVLRTWLGVLAHAAHLHAPVDAARLRRRASAPTPPSRSTP